MHAHAQAHARTTRTQTRAPAEAEKLEQIPNKACNTTCNFLVWDKIQSIFVENHTDQNMCYNT